MRIMTYNVLDGGLGRIDPLAEVILAQEPDVLCLQEVTDESRLDQLNARLGMHVSLGRPTTPGDRPSMAVAILTREPVEWHQAIYLSPDRSALRVDFKKPKLSVVTLHLTGRATRTAEATRLEQWARLQVATAFLQHPSLLCGDFNAQPPAEDVDATQLRDQDAAHLERDGAPTVPQRLYPAVVAAGWVDVAAKLGTAKPTFTAERPALRYDHVFANAAAEPLVTACAVVESRLARFASDHLPVVADLTLA